MSRKSRTGLTPKALKRAINVSLSYTHKLRSSAPMDDDADIQRIRARLANYGTPQEIAEEGFRVYRVKAGLRAELDKMKKAAAATTAVPTHSSSVSLAPSASTSSTAGTIPITKITTTASTRTIPITNTAMSSTIIPPQTIKALKNKIAVIRDALTEMRNEAPKMRECMAWMWDIIGHKRVNHVPKQLRDMYYETMAVDLVDWKPKGRMGEGRAS